MSHATEAEVAIQRALSLEKTRFGLDSDRQALLEEALRHLSAIIAEERTAEAAGGAASEPERPVEAKPARARRAPRRAGRRTK